MGGRGWGVVSVLVLLLPNPLRGQIDDVVLPGPRLVAAGGALTTDFEDQTASGDGHLIGARLDFPLGRRVFLESSVERISLDGTETSSTRWQVEFAARFEWPAGRLRPFVGGGAGALLWPGDERPVAADFVVATYGALGGVRFEMTERFDVRAEVRRRWLDGLESSITTFGAGLGWRF